VSSTKRRPSLSVEAEEEEGCLGIRARFRNATPSCNAAATKNKDRQAQPCTTACPSTIFEARSPMREEVERMPNAMAYWEGWSQRETMLVIAAHPEDWATHNRHIKTVIRDAVVLKEMRHVSPAEAKDASPRKTNRGPTWSTLYPMLILPKR